jgi:formylglycine-generating enzyme
MNGVSAAGAAATALCLVACGHVNEKPSPGLLDSTANGTSCQTSGPGLTNCGANTESCCTSLLVTGGTFDRTYTSSASGATGEADPATVSGVRLDKYLVTVGRFRQFVRAVSGQDGGAGWMPPAGSGKHVHVNGGSGLNATTGGYEPGWVATDDAFIAPSDDDLACAETYSTWTSSAQAQENLPINCVNWYEAYAFCIWDGGFLPSAAEAEYAAAGGSQQREQPWGSADPGMGDQYAIYGCYYPSGLTGICTGATNIAPVGTATLGAGLWGQLDLTGELYGWSLDWYGTYADPCTDCVDTAMATYRVLWGGHFDGDTSSLLLPNPSTFDPSLRVYDVGVRCARAP